MKKEKKKTADTFEDDVGKAREQQLKNDEADQKAEVEKALEELRDELKAELGEMTKDQKRKLENVITTMRRVMSAENIYTKEMTYQLRSTAQTILLKNRIFAEAIKQPPLIVEQSRESDSRVKVAPIYQLYLQYDNLLRHDLRALRLNAEAKGGKEDKDDGDDALLTMLRKQREEDEEE